ncbi:armadillo-type protein [Mycena olivaceomarginata]|nr:armadillo-type protein [Mycena olivaceomarginata]
MPPLTRQESRPSIYSWWSDSNPGLQGPTINLHAAAKPLMRLMYYRQASEILRKNRGSPLTTAILETYSSYFPGEDSLVRWVTYTLSQIAQWVDGAKGVVDAKALDHILRLLASPNPDTQESASILVGNLACHKSTAPAVLKLNPSVQLVSLLGGEDSLVRWVTYALSRIARWADGAKGVVDAKALDHVLRLLKSPNPKTRESASILVGNLACHKSTAPAVLKLNPSLQLVSLLGGEDSLVHWVTYALSQIARSVDGAKDVVDAKALDHILRLLESPNLDIREWASKLVGWVASHESTAPAVLKLTPCVQLVSLLGGEDSLVHWVMFALSWITKWVDGAKDVVDAKVLDHILRLLESPNPDTQGWACLLVQGLAIHKATAPAILQLKPIPQLESLLQDPDPLIRDNAISALEAIRRSMARRS